MCHLGGPYRRDHTFDRISQMEAARRNGGLPQTPPDGPFSVLKQGFPFGVTILGALMIQGAIFSAVDGHVILAGLLYLPALQRSGTEPATVSGFVGAQSSVNLWRRHLRRYSFRDVPARVCMAAIYQPVREVRVLAETLRHFWELARQIGTESIGSRPLRYAAALASFGLFSPLAARSLTATPLRSQSAFSTRLSRSRPMEPALLVEKPAEHKNKQCCPLSQVPFSPA